MEGEKSLCSGAAPNALSLTLARSLNTQISVSVGPIERRGSVEVRAAGPEPAEKQEVDRPVRGRHSLTLAILAVGLVVVAIILAGTYAYHRLWRTPEEVAMQLARDVSDRVREIFNMTPRVT